MVDSQRSVQQMSGDQETLLTNNSYTVFGDQSVFDILRHFTSRGHRGRVNCVDAGAQVDYIVSGGVDYTFRVWKYDRRYEAYDVVAILLQTPPPGRTLPDWTIWGSIKELVLPTYVNWDDEEHKGWGITAVACSYSRRGDMFTKESMRNGPFICGNAHGDLHVLCLHSGNQAVDGGHGRVEAFVGLHNGTVNDVAVAPTYLSNSDGTEFFIMTAGNDGASAFISMKCEEIPNPNYSGIHEDVQDVGRIAFNFLFRGAGLPKLSKHPNRSNEVYRSAVAEEASNGIEDEEESEDEADTCLQLVSATVVNKVKHDEEVVKVKFLGDSHTVCFATSTTSAIFLWNEKGEMTSKLLMETTTKGSTMSIGGKQKMQYQFKAKKLSRIATVCKEDGALLFAVGEDKDGTTNVAVWGINDGKVGVISEDGLAYDEEDAKHPIAVYRQPGLILDVDQSGTSTTFAVDVRDEGLNCVMWSLEAVEPGLLLLEPQGPASLLIRPGRELVMLELVHSYKVIDTRVVKDPSGPALISACDDGTIFCWDLEGNDKGQIYGELRSLNTLEIVLPPIMLLVTAVQMLSFAFGPAVPWKTGIAEPAADVHQVMMFNFEWTVKIDKDIIFWTKTHAVMTAMVFFQAAALMGLPEMCEGLVRSVQNHESFKAERNPAGPWHFLYRTLDWVRFGVYLAMQLLSTILVVPMMTSCAQALNCVIPEGVPFTDAILLNPHDTIYLHSAPDVMCYKGAHLSTMLGLFLIVPIYLILLTPYAVCAGDAHYVPRAALYDFQIWKDDNAWRKAAQRSASDLHLAFLHLTPDKVFRTNLLELMAKIFLPVMTTLCAEWPLEQMIIVFIIGLVMWLNSLLHPPYVERKFTILVQQLKLFTACTMGCGVLTVYLDNPKSSLPLLILGWSGIVTFTILVIQLAVLKAQRPSVRSFKAERSAQV